MKAKEAAGKKFEAAVNATPKLRGALKPGLGALRAEDKPHIKPHDTRSLLGSVDVDKALKASQPNANRWDFVIGYEHGNRDEPVLYWIEIHTGSDSEFKVVLRKFEWLLDWMKGDGKFLAAFEREIVWIASGATSFTAASRQRRIMAQKGLRYAGACLRIPELMPG